MAARVASDRIRDRRLAAFSAVFWFLPLGRRLQALLGYLCGHDDVAGAIAPERELVERQSDVLRAEAEKAAHADDDRHDVAVAVDAQVVDIADRFVRRILDALIQESEIGRASC